MEGGVACFLVESAVVAEGRSESEILVSMRGASSEDWSPEGGNRCLSLSASSSGSSPDGGW